MVASSCGGGCGCCCRCQSRWRRRQLQTTSPCADDLFTQKRTKLFYVCQSWRKEGVELSKTVATGGSRSRGRDCGTRRRRRHDSWTRYRPTRSLVDVITTSATTVGDILTVVVASGSARGVGSSAIADTIGWVVTSVTSVNSVRDVRSGAAAARRWRRSGLRLTARWGSCNEAHTRARTTGTR